MGIAAAGLIFGIHLIEGEALTPMLLARRFTLNPVLVILSLVFWFWMWGVPGAILAVPILAILRNRVRPRPLAKGLRAFSGGLSRRPPCRLSDIRRITRARRSTVC